MGTATELLRDPQVIGLLIASLCLLFALGIAFAKGVQYSIAFDKLPAAVRWSELETQVGALEGHRTALEEDIKAKQAALTALEKVEAQVEYWTTQLELVKAEYAGLEGQRKDIADTREEYRKCAEELTLAEVELRKVQAEAKQARELADGAAASIESSKQAVGDLEKRLGEAVAEHAAQEEKLAGSKAALEQMQEERSHLRAERDDLQERMRALSHEYEETSARVENSRKQADELKAAVEEIAKEAASLPAKRDEIRRVKAELEEASKTKLSLEEMIEEKRRQENRLLRHISDLEVELAESGATGGAEKERLSLQDLTKPPACFATERRQGDGVDPVYPTAARDVRESDALNRLMANLEASGLHFSPRTIKAFHTSLKTAVISPLTILAGISGTGKSQLPRFYADAMGVHFLKIPVQPRWDGPQDLFGFYNYIEKQYRATDLARALVHLDSSNWPDLAKNYEDRMLLVLLDEMNLARVEYYFSEFLSRLEGRPLEDSEASAADRRPSEIDIEVSRQGQTKRVYAGQNVLFVGTMNEDESTLSLSDKVLDRANVIRFPRPAELRETLVTIGSRQPTTQYLPKSVWMKKWIRSIDDLSAGQRERAKAFINRTNDILSVMGRSYGHRMAQAMLHYVANYPAAQNGEEVKFGLADQIEQRILPKLRGIMADTYRSHLLELADMVSGDLGDAVLAAEIQATVERAREHNNLFIWRGVARPE